MAGTTPRVTGLTVSVVNDNATLASWGLAIKGFSRLRATLTVDPDTIDGQSVSRRVYFYGTEEMFGSPNDGNAFLSGVLREAKGRVAACVWQPDDDAWSAWYYNTPNHTQQEAPTLSVYDYQAPVLTAARAFRSDSSGQASETGSYIHITLDARFSTYTVSGQTYNAGARKYRYREAGASSWSGYVTLAAGVTEATIHQTGGFSAGKTYEVELAATDELGGYATQSFIVSRRLVAFDLKEGGRGGAFGGYASEDQVLNSFWEYKYKGVRLPLLEGSILIPVNADLDDYAEPGTYYSPDGATSRTLLHTPFTTYGFKLIVEKTGGPEVFDRRQRIITSLRDCVEYVRTSTRGTNDTRVWRDWITQNADVHATGVRVYHEGPRGSVAPWDVLHAFPGYVVANLRKSYEAGDVQKDTTGENEYPGVVRSKELYLSLPFPLATPTLTGSGSLDGIYLSDVNYLGNVVASFRLFSAKKYGASDDFPALDASFSVQGLLAEPPTDPPADAPGMTYMTVPTRAGTAVTPVGADEALQAAQSYIDAAAGSPPARYFSYGQNWLYLLPPEGVDPDSEEATLWLNTQDMRNGVLTWCGRMECDTFVNLLLRCIPYARSPYAVSRLPANTETFDYAGINTSAYADTSKSWVQRLVAAGTGLPANTYLGRDVRFAADLAWYCWLQGWVFSDVSQARPGDLVFVCRDASKKYFGGVTHVAMLDCENRAAGTGQKYIYEATTFGNSNGKVVQKIPLTEEMIKQAYFARVDYS